MVTRTALVTDSTCNVPPDLAADRHIYVAPLYILWGDDTYRDGVDLTEPQLFERLETASVLPKTSQVSPQDFAGLFTHAHEVEEADEVVCGVISCDLSGTYASAIQAKDMVDFPVRVVDTRQASWGLGFPMLAAAAARDAGATPDKIARVIQESSERSRVFFTVESLEYLHRGGRIGAASRFLGSALNIKPILQLNEGVVIPVDKVRTRKRAVERMLKMAADCAAGQPIQRLAIIHGDAEAEGQLMLETAVEQFGPDELYLSFVTAVVGVHVGPGALGIIVEW